MTPWPHILTGIAYAILAGGFATAIGAMIATIVNSPVQAEQSRSGTAATILPVAAAQLNEDSNRD